MNFDYYVAVSQMSISGIKTASFYALCLIILGAVLGCGFVERLQRTEPGSNAANSNKTITDKAVDTAIGESKIGVPECDEVLDLLAAEANNPDDGFVAKAVKATFLNKIKDAIKRSVEENKGDPAQLAKSCTEFKTQLQKFKAEQKSAQ